MARTLRVGRVGSITPRSTPPVESLDGGRPGRWTLVPFKVNGGRPGGHNRGDGAPIGRHDRRAVPRERLHEPRRDPPARRRIRLDRTWGWRRWQRHSLTFGPARLLIDTHGRFRRSAGQARVADHRRSCGCRFVWCVSSCRACLRCPAAWDRPGGTRSPSGQRRRWA